MRPLVLLWSCLVLPGYGALMGPKAIREFEGGTVSLQCTYREELRENKKYWCRRAGLFLPRCSDAIYIDDGQEKTEGRVSIQDSPQELMFHVTLRNLSMKDTGKYWCGVKMLGLDETFLVSLTVLPGPCCSSPFPTPPFQPLATTSLQPKSTTWQTQLPELTSPGLHSTVTATKRGKTEAEAFPFPETSPYDHAGNSLYTGTSPYAGASPHTATSPNEATSPHKATSPHAGTSSPAPYPDPTSTEDNRLITSSRSKSRMSRSVVRILAPVLVLLTLLLATGLAALGRYMLQWRKKALRAMQTQRNEKVYLSHLNQK